MEAAGELVPEPAVRHPLQGAPGGAKGLGPDGTPRFREMPAEQQDRLSARRELGRRPEAAVLRVVGAEQASDARGRRLRSDEFAGRAASSGKGRRGAQPGQQPLPAGEQAGPLRPVGPGLGDPVEDPAEAGPAPPVLRREVGAAEERGPVRGDEDGERPAPGAGGALDERHVDLVHLGPLLPVHLHRHEEPVHPLGEGGIREGLPRHHMAPVATGVADGEQHRAVAPPGLGEGLRPPALPVDRVVPVLAEVGAGLPPQPVPPSGLRRGTHFRRPGRRDAGPAGLRRFVRRPSGRPPFPR